MIFRASSTGCSHIKQIQLLIVHQSAYSRYLLTGHVDPFFCQEGRCDSPLLRQTSKTVKINHVLKTPRLKTSTD